MLSGQARYIIRRERSGGYLFDRQSGALERIAEGHFTLLDRAHNLGTGASGVRKYLSESFADERTAEAFLSNCVRRGILSEDKGSSLQIVHPPLPSDRLPTDCHSAPSRLFWRITTRSSISTDVEACDIPLDKAQALLKAVADAGTFEIWITGGEPSQHPAFHQIVSAAKEEGLYVTLETRAMFDEARRQKMLDSLVDRFAVTVAGGAVTHDAFYGEGAYSSMVEFISRTAQRGVKPITFVLPYGKSNLDKIKDAIGMVKAIRGEELLVLPGSGDEALPLNIYADRLKETAGLAEGLGVLVSSPFELHKDGEWHVTGCAAGVSEAYLDEKGMLRACRYCDIVAEPLGDLLELGYIALWLDANRFSSHRHSSPGCQADRRLFIKD